MPKPNPENREQDCELYREQDCELYADELPEEQDLHKSCVRPFTPRVTLAEWMKSASRDAGRLRQERGF